MKTRRPLKEKERYANLAEDAVYQRFKGDWTLSRSGYPDFTVYDENENIVAMIEVKTRPTQRLRERQRRFLHGMARLGVKCYTWNPEEGFIRIESD